MSTSTSQRRLAAQLYRDALRTIMEAAAREKVKLFGANVRDPSNEELENLANECLRSAEVFEQTAKNYD